MMESLVTILLFISAMTSVGIVVGSFYEGTYVESFSSANDNYNDGAEYVIESASIHLYHYCLKLGESVVCENVYPLLYTYIRMYFNDRVLYIKYTCLFKNVVINVKKPKYFKLNQIIYTVAKLNRKEPKKYFCGLLSI